MISSHSPPRQEIGGFANLTSRCLARRSPGRPRGMLVQEGFFFFFHLKGKKKRQKANPRCPGRARSKVTPAPLVRLMLFKAARAGEVAQCPFC